MRTIAISVSHWGIFETEEIAPLIGVASFHHSGNTVLRVLRDK